MGQDDGRWDPTWGRGRGGHGRPPFGDTVVTAWHFERPPTDEVLEALEWELLRARRSGALVSPPGSGRSHLLRLLADWINPVQWESVYVPNPRLDDAGFCRIVLGLLGKVSDEEDPAGELERRLEQLWAEGRSLLLLIDDAELMPESTVRACLARAERHSPTLVLVFAVAADGPVPTPFEEREGFPVVRLRAPLDRAEVRDYLQHRLERSGAAPDVRARFTHTACARLHDLAGDSLVHLHTLAQALVEISAGSPEEAWSRFMADDRGLLALEREAEQARRAANGDVDHEAREGAERRRPGMSKVQRDADGDAPEKLAG